MGEGAELGIGEFALLTGLSVTRLRRYHALNLLVPARVDPATGYRHYDATQIEHGRWINRLRQVDLPLDDLAALLADRERAASALRRHRRQLVDRLSTMNRMVELIDQLIAEERATMTTTSLQLMEVTLRVDDVDATVAFYRDVFEMEFQADDHNGALPIHYDACGGSWDPEGFFLFTIYPAEGRPTVANIGFGVPDVNETWRRAMAAHATEIAPPADPGYVPRHAVFEDNAGNRVNVYHRGDAW